MRRLLLAALLGTLTTALLPTSAPAASVYLRMPSGNIQCSAGWGDGGRPYMECWVYSTFGQRCTYASAWLLYAIGPVKQFCPGDRPGPQQGRVLGYGTTWNGGAV